jgi:hypothetical protein
MRLRANCANLTLFDSSSELLILSKKVCQKNLLSPYEIRNSSRIIRCAV